MAKRFYSEFNNLRNEHFTIEIWDSSFASSATTFNPGADGFSISYKGDAQERTGTILATECKVSFRIETSEHDTFLTDIITSKEGRFTLKITKGTGSPTLFWVGLIIADVGQYQEAYHPYFTLSAVDGLGLLKDEEYMNGANFYAGKASLKDHIINALARLEYVDTHFATSERFLRIAVDWWEETMTNNSTNDPMALTYVDHSVWWVYKKEVKKARSCWDVLDNILRCFGARITMHEGVFWVEQITYRTASTIVLRNYDKAGTYINSTNFSNANTINQTASGALFNGGVYEFFAPLSEARHVFEVNLHQNLLASYAFSNSNTSDTINRPVEANSGAATLWLAGNITLKIVNPSFTAGPLVQPGFAIFRCQLKIGSRWLENDYTVQNYQVNFGSLVWETTNSYFYISVALPNGLPPPQTLAPGIFYTYQQAINIMTPQLPSGSDTFDFSIELLEYTQGISLVNFTSTWDFPTPWLEPFSFGNPALNDDEWEYETTNPDVENTKIHETTCLIGNSTDPNATGALWVKPSSTYILADDWQDGTDTPDRDIEKLNIELVLGGQQIPIRRLSGTLYGTLTLMGRVVWDSVNWLLLGGTYNAAQAQMQGEWFELDYDGAGLTTSGPIRKKVAPGGNPDVPPLDGGGNFTGLPVYKLNSAGPGTLLYPVAQTRTLDEISAGAITSIDITDTLEDEDFAGGDILVILNPVTGFFEELTVSTDSVAGDDFILVGGTLTATYPPDSPLIKKPLISAYQLPSGTTGKILRHNGTRWRSYGATTAGDVLTWDAVQGWIAATPGSGGTVTSVALTMPTAIFDVAGSPITTSGTLAVTLDTQTANTVWAGPTSGGAAAPTFRALVAADIPAVSSSAITGLTANQVLYGGGGGGIAQDADFTFDGTDVTLGAGKITVFKTGIFNNQHTNKVTVGSAVGSETYPGIWFGSATPSITNYAFLADVGASQSILNAPSGGNISLRVNNSQVGRITSTGLALSTGNPVNKLDVSGAAVIGATYAGTNTAPTNGLLVQGSVAIGNTTAAQTLHVQGTARITGSDGTATTIMGRDGDGDVSAITVSTGLNLSGNVLTATAGTNYQTLRDDGSAMTQRANANFVSNSEITFTLTDDAGNTETEIASALATNAVGNAKFRQSAGLSVVGRSANTTGDVADITAGTDGHVLRRSGTVLGFGALNMADTNTVSGVLQVGNGGTGLNALGTANQLIRVNAGATSLEYFTPTYLTANQTITLSGDVTGSGTTAITTTIAANAVTDAKFRQSAGLSVVGRSANTTGDVADITAASDFQVMRRSGTSIAFGSINLASTNAVTGTLPVGNGGTGAATLADNSVLTGTGTSAITAESNLLFNGTQLQIGTGTPLGYLNIYAATLSGATEFIRMSANVNNNMIVSHLNASNATTAANSIYQMSVGGASAGDPLIQFTVSGVGQTAIGVDNSDADKFKITPGASVPGGTANRGLIVTNDATAFVGINKDAPAQPLDVTGRGRANQWCQIQANPTVVFGAGAGTGASGSCTGGANSFQISFTTGTSPTTNGLIFTVTLPTAFPAVLHFTWSPRNAQAATDLNKFLASAFSASQLTISANGTLAASTQYIFYFVGCGY